MFIGVCEFPTCYYLTILFKFNKNTYVYIYKCIFKFSTFKQKPYDMTKNK